MAKKILTLIGTRPEIIKMSPLIPELDNVFEHLLVDSGQHYSPRMHAIFFQELQLRQPDFFLKVGSHLPGEQVALILERFDEILTSVRPNAVIVQGDTNTALAGALAVSKHWGSGIRLIHVEAGTRSFISDQPEEINRKIVDRLSDLLFAPYADDCENLLKEGIDTERIKVVGNTVVDGCRRIAATLNETSESSKYGLQSGAYILVTFHRQETVDEESRLREVCGAILEISSSIPVIVPLHPRTKKMLLHWKMDFKAPGLVTVDPLGYGSAVSLLRDSRFCITDSGGVQEEAAVLGIPVLVLRENTEHKRYVEAGMHRIVGTNRHRILKEARLLLQDPKEYMNRKQSRISFIPNTTARIIKEIKAFLDGND